MPNGQPGSGGSMRQASMAPTNKVTVGAATGAVVTIVVWVLNTWDLLPGGQDVPAEIAAALTTVLTFAAAYFVPPAARDGIVERNGSSGS